jgi:hypothetical protein
VVASFVSFVIVGLVLRGPPRPKVVAVGFAAAIDPPVTRDRAAA